MDVKKHWDDHYKDGGNSGNGAYGEQFNFKTKVINWVIEKMNIESVCDFGCGDGHQLSELKVKEYLGFDISETAVEICKKRYLNNPNLNFMTIEDQFSVNKKFDLVMSLDVIYHLVEDHLYFKHLENLINFSAKYILIYSSNSDDLNWKNHVRHRKFTKDLTQVKFLTKIDQVNPLTSSADFYLFEKINSQS